MEADLPIPKLPEVLSPAREVNPATFREDNRLTPEVTVNDPPTPTLPVVTNDPPTPRFPDKVKLVKEGETKVGEEEVEISWMVLTAPELTVKLVELKDATPLTEVEASIPAMVKVPPNDTGEPDTDSPVPAVPVTVIDEFSSSELLIDPAGSTTDPPVTASPPDSTVPEVTLRDFPIPKLPEISMEEPTPTNPEKYPVPDTFKL